MIVITIGGGVPLTNYKVQMAFKTLVEEIINVQDFKNPHILGD
jgi:hypothetical protein